MNLIDFINDIQIFGEITKITYIYANAVII
jgi:hypothetical protein